jgi:hypothetical protein
MRISNPETLAHQARQASASVIAKTWIDRYDAGVGLRNAGGDKGGMVATECPSGKRAA